MDPQSQFCPNEHCRARGLRGQGTIHIHSQKEGRYRCTTCRGTFSATTGTAFFRLRTPATVVMTVVTLLAHGCPRQAIVAAFGLDERTVASWQERAGGHCQRVHTHLVQAGQVDLQHVQADEIYVKIRTPPRAEEMGTEGQNTPAASLASSAGKGRVWQAMALAVPSRLWLGGVISARRDRHLIAALATRVRACGRSTRVLVCVDGLRRVVHIRAGSVSRG